MKRRHFLLAGGLVAGSAYINHRALRYPRLSFEPKELPTDFHYQSGKLDLLDFIALSNTALGNTPATPISLRAIAPEPKLTIHAQEHTSDSLTIRASNISANASLQVNADPSINIHEVIDGIHRTIEINKPSNKPIELAWKLPSESVRFAAIGDTGGDTELDWCLQRAAQLEADFLLFLGDLNYGDGEYDRAIEQFNKSSIPIYVTIGNHDFNDSGLVYQQFLDQIGPQNHSFVIANTRFINVDTAVNFLPAYSGNRGRLMREIKSSAAPVDNHVVFTHKPFVDSREGQDHDISGVGEKSWLRNAMADIGARNLLCGHVHHSTERDYEGIQQWTAGEGLGYEDLIAQKQVSKILIGSITEGEPVAYEWKTLEMPWAMHNNKNHKEKLIRDNHLRQLEWYEQLLQKNA